jgi:hypothetical protein
MTACPIKRISSPVQVIAQLLCLGEDAGGSVFHPIRVSQELLNTDNLTDTQGIFKSLCHAKCRFIEKQKTLFRWAGTGW